MMNEVRRCAICFEEQAIDAFNKYTKHFNNKSVTYYQSNCKRCYHYTACERKRCECGRFYTHSNRARHIKSHMHKEWLLDKKLYIMAA